MPNKQPDLPTVKPDEGLIPKRFHWSSMKKLQIKGTYWEQLLKVEDGIKINYKILNKFFCEKESDIKKKAKKGPKVTSSSQKMQVKVLDPKASQNIAIILSTYSLGMEDTIRALND